MGVGRALEGTILVHSTPEFTRQGTEENCENTQDSRPPERNSNREPLQNETTLTAI